MNIGIRLHDTAPGTLEQRLDFARAQGFSCAHLALSKALDGFSMAEAPERLRDEALARRVKAAFSDRGMDCAVLGCYLKLADADDARRARTREIYRAHLRFAARIGAGVVGTETPLAGDGDPHSEEAFQFFLRCVRPVAEDAREAGAILAVEPVCSHIVSTPEKAERMLEALRSDPVAIILDAVNLVSSADAARAEAIIDEAVRRLGDRVRVLHMKDFIEASGQPRPTPVACGQGHMRYESLLALAKRRALPMTLENTVPDNAEAARLYLEGLGASLP